MDARTRHAAEAGAQTAREQCPVDQGNLRDSIKVTKIEGQDVGYRVSCGGSIAPHAAAVVTGTENRPAHPFMYMGLLASLAALKKW